LAGQVESEIKLRMTGPGPAREAVARLGATLVRPRHFEDNVLLDDAGGALVGSGRTLRLRRTDAGAVLTFKGPRRDREGVKSREEIEAALPAAEADALLAVLRSVGFAPVFRYQKYRETYRHGDVEIVVDETPIGTFLEIEGALPEIHAAAAALGLGPADYVTDSYGGLFSASGGKGDMVFPP
jgi:adenylate cyclase, class 2